MQRSSTSGIGCQTGLPPIRRSATWSISTSAVRAGRGRRSTARRPAQRLSQACENLTVEEEATLALEDVRTCHDRLVSEGIDLPRTPAQPVRSISMT